MWFNRCVLGSVRKWQTNSIKVSFIQADHLPHLPEVKPYCVCAGLSLFCWCFKWHDQKWGTDIKLHPVVLHKKYNCNWTDDGAVIHNFTHKELKGKTDHTFDTCSAQFAPQKPIGQEKSAILDFITYVHQLKQSCDKYFWDFGALGDCGTQCNNKWARSV